MLFQLLLLSAIQFPFTGRGSDNASASGQKLPMIVPYEEPKDYDTHIISFYGVKGSVTNKAIQGISSTLIVIYDQKSCLDVDWLPRTNRIRHHFHKSSAALLDLFSFWSTLFEGIKAGISSREESERIFEDFQVGINELLDQIEPGTSQTVRKKMNKDPLFKHIAAYAMKQPYRIEVILVFYKVAIDHLYELVRGELPKWVAEESIPETIPKKIRQSVCNWDTLFKSITTLMDQPITPEMQKMIARELRDLRAAALRVNKLINGALILKHIDQWEKDGIIKRHHVDIYFDSSRYPIPLITKNKGADTFEFKHHFVNEWGKVSPNSRDLFGKVLDYEVELKKFAEDQVPMIAKKDEAPTPKDYKTHIISFYGVEGFVTEKIIQRSSNLIVTYDKNQCIAENHRIKHHFHKSSDALIELLSFWSTLFECIKAGISSRQQKERIFEPFEKKVNELLDQIEPGTSQTVREKMNKDPLFKHIADYAMKQPYRIEVILVFYKVAIDHVYELVRGELPKWVAEESIPETIPEKLDHDDCDWNKLFASIPALMNEPITPGMQGIIADELHYLRAAALKLNKLINGAMILKHIDQWGKDGLLKRHHVDVYFDVSRYFYPISLTAENEGKVFEYKYHFVEESGNVLHNRQDLVEKNQVLDYKVELRKFAVAQVPMIAKKDQVPKGAKESQVDTHVISFYGVEGSVTKEIIQRSSNLIVTYDEKQYIAGKDVKHHFHKSSALLMELLSFWSTLFNGIAAGISSRAQSMPIFQRLMGDTCYLLDQIEPGTAQTVRKKMNKDPLYQQIARYAEKQPYRIEVIMVFYKVAMDHVYELVRGELSQYVTEKSILQNIPKKIDQNVWNNLFKSITILMDYPITLEMQDTIADNLRHLKEAVWNLNTLINGAMIKKYIDQWIREGMLKKKHVDIYFNSYFPIPFKRELFGENYEIKYHSLDEQGTESCKKREDFDENMDFHATLTDFAQGQICMIAEKRHASLVHSLILLAIFLAAILVRYFFAPRSE